MRKFGLLGKNISYSFSKKYFESKFHNLGLSDCNYVNFDFENVDEIKVILAQQPDIIGFNVTIPYKEAIIPFLHSISEEAKIIGAVNTVKVSENGNLEGHNTDWIGFNNSIQPLLQKYHKKALILGNGGASKAIVFAFQKLDIETLTVSRNPKDNEIHYSEINSDILNTYQIIVNCSPLGTFPKIDKCPNIPYHLINNQHLVYDLIYNPEETLFLNQAKNQQATTKNGLEMLTLQAEAAWEIWNS